MFVSNLIIALFSLGPPVLALCFYKRFPGGYRKQLIYGLGLIVWSMVTFSLLSDLLARLEGVDMGDPVLKQSVVSTVNLWMFAYPAVVLAVGSNFVAQFFFSWDES